MLHNYIRFLDNISMTLWEYDYTCMGYDYKAILLGSAGDVISLTVALFHVFMYCLRWKITCAIMFSGNVDPNGGF